MFPLSVAPINQGFKIQKIYADQKIKSRLDNLGIIVGGEVTPIIAHRGDIIVMVKGCRLALNKELASKILVK